MEAAVVDSVDVTEGAEFDLFDGAAGSLPGDELVLVEPSVGLRACVVDRVSDRTDRGGGVDLGEAFGGADAGVACAPGSGWATN